jgi:hypothetical protein
MKNQYREFRISLFSADWLLTIFVIGWLFCNMCLPLLMVNRIACLIDEVRFVMF